MTLFTLAWILIFFDWNLYLTERAVLGLLPDFIGWLLLWLVLQVQKNQGAALAQAKRYLCPMMAGLTGVRYLLDALGLIGDVSMPVGCVLGLAMSLPAVAMAGLLIRDWTAAAGEEMSRLHRVLFWVLALGEAGTYLLLFEPFLALVPLAAALVGKLGVYLCLRPLGQRLLFQKKKKR